MLGSREIDGNKNSKEAGGRVPERDQHVIARVCGQPHRTSLLASNVVV